MRKFLLVVPLGILFLSAGCIKPAAPSVKSIPVDYYSRQLLIGDQTLMVEVVNDSDKMARGLSGRAAMADNQGMLFDFGSPQIPQFWMKDMGFNLDFIWIKNHKIIFITSDVAAPTKNISDDQLPLYTPPSPVDEVLEVNAGWSRTHGIKVGDRVELK